MCRHDLSLQLPVCFHLLFNCSCRLEVDFFFHPTQKLCINRLWPRKAAGRDTQLPGSAPDPLFQSAAVLSAPTPSPSSSSPLHELFVVFAGTPAPAAASPSCAASLVQSASWAVSQYVIKMSRRRNARSGPVAALLWNYPAGLPPPEQTVMVNRQTLHTDTC